MAKKTWRKALDAAKERGKFLDSDNDAAGQWLTCAVGERVGKYSIDRLGNDSWPYPQALDLRELGEGFAMAVMRNNVYEAESLYKKIQAWFRRSAKRRKARQEA